MIDVVTSSQNISESRQIVFPAYYYIDDNEFYYLILFHQSMCFYIIAIVVLGSDTLCMIMVEHVCGTFEILR